MDIIRDRIDLVQKLAQSIERQLQRQLDQHVLGPLGLTASVGQVALAVGVSTAVAYSVARYIVYNLYLHPISKVPGPPVDRLVPFGGNMREIFREESGVPHKKWIEKYGGVLLYHGPWNTPRLLVTDPVALREILTTRVYDYAKPPDSVIFLKRLLGEGLLVAEGEVHRRQRKMLNPAFSVQTIRDLAPLMAIPAVHLCEKWLREIEGKGEEPAEVIVSHGLSLATLDVIGLAGFGQDFSSVKYDGTEKSNKLSSAYLTIFSTDRAFSLLQFLSFFFPFLRKVPTKRNLEFAWALRWLDEESEAVVHRGIERADKMNHNNLLCLMIKSSEEQGDKFSIKELQNQCLTFLAAGHETTSTSLSWCLWLLAQHQDIQDALRAEVKPLFEKLNTNHDIFTKDPFDHSDLSSANIPSYDAINNLKLLNNVCKETMRLIPPVPVTNRISTKDATLGGYFVPKGTVIFLSLISNLHSKAIWGEDADEFRPSRWDEEPASKVSPYEYAPFLAGNRQCIGNRFAMIEMKILLAIIITRFQIFEKPGFVPKKRQSITLRPTPNMTLLLKPL